MQAWFAKIGLRELFFKYQDLYFVENSGEIQFYDR